MKQKTTSLLFWDIAIFLGLPTILTVISIVFGLDEKIAVAIYDPSDKFAWFIRQYSQMPGTVISVLCIAFMLIPYLRLRFETWRHMALIWLIALIFGGGLIVNVILKEAFERPRPRETELLGGHAAYTQPFTPAASIKGKSFPSGHAAIGAMMLVPFFTLRRRKETKKLAYGILAFGTVYTALISYSRMVLGAHFITDTIWSFAIVATSAAISSHYISFKADLKARIILPFLIAVIFSIAWFNNFKIELHHEIKSADIILDTPCKLIDLKDGDKFTADVKIKGFGGPTSQLVLNESDGKLSLVRWKGVFRELSCTAVITLPESKTLHVDKDASVHLRGDISGQISDTHIIFYRNARKRG